MNEMQAALAVQLVIDQIWALQASQMVVASAGDPNAMLQAERRGQGLKRNAAAGARQLAQQRALMVKMGEAAAPPGVWDYDLAELEAIWLAAPAAGALATEVAAAKPGKPLVPLWKQNGRQYIHQCSDAEIDELEAAKARGEAIEWPPYHPRDPVALGWRPDPNPRKPYKYWEEMTMAERRERYGWKSEAELAAEKEAAAKAAGEAGQAAAAGG